MNNFRKSILYLSLAFVLIWQCSLKAQWVKCAPVPGDNNVGSGAQLNYLAVNGSRLFVPRTLKADSVFYSDNNGGTWNFGKLPPWVIGGTSYPPVVTGVWVNNGVIFASGSVSQGNVLWRSTDNGVNWIASSSGIIASGNDPTPKVFIASGTTAYVGTGNSGIFLSTDNGVTWNAARVGIPTYIFGGTNYVNINCFARIGNDVFVGLGGDFSAHGYGLRHTTLGGTTWDSLGTGLPASSLVYSMISVGTTLYAQVVSFSSGRGLYKSTDLGATWTNSNNGLPNRNNLGAGAEDLYAVGNTIFAGTISGDYVSTNGGGSWAAMNNTGLPASYYINGYEVVGSTMFITAVDLTTLPTTTAVWERALSQITDVVEISSAVPDEFSLGQNYPNPFNPSSTISFSIPSSGLVTLKVYDALGKEVAVLLNEVKEPGSYNVKFNADNLSSGIYLYKIKSGTYTATKKMILLK